MWIGLFGDDNDGFAWRESPTYQFPWKPWHPIEPNDNNNDQSCAVLVTGGALWADIDCDVTLPFLCQYKMDNPGWHANINIFRRWIDLLMFLALHRCTLKRQGRGAKQ